MDDEVRRRRDESLRLLDELIRRGRWIRERSAMDLARMWYQDCAAAVNQLSGGSKAHWLARAFSEAFLVRGGDSGPVLEADATEIIDRMLDVLAQGSTSLSRMEAGEATSLGEPSQPRRFPFVHNRELRPILEVAFDDSRRAFDRGEFALALILSCSVIDAIITDALDHTASLADGDVDSAAHGAAPPARRFADWRFEQRIGAAERAGLIQRGCARLPRTARAYRDLTDANGHLHANVLVTERDARIAGQVLRVVMRDLDPGR